METTLAEPTTLFGRVQGLRDVLKESVIRDVVACRDEYDSWAPYEAHRDALDARARLLHEATGLMWDSVAVPLDLMLSGVVLRADPAGKKLCARLSGVYRRVASLQARMGGVARALESTTSGDVAAQIELGRGLLERAVQRLTCDALILTLIVPSSPVVHDGIAV